MFNAYLVSINSENEMNFLSNVLNKLGYANNHFYWWTGAKAVEEDESSGSSGDSSGETPWGARSTRKWEWDNPGGGGR